ncbi:hypothetical protein [Aquimarina muelleri]|nr:hypothetical protein [Aquimarina muelleri]MCX2763720.1 hypothetical protein [Aquimarina muelleri]
MMIFTNCATPDSNDEIYEIETKGADKGIKRPGTQSADTDK